MSARRVLSKVILDEAGFHLTVKRYRATEQIHVYAYFTLAEGCERWKICQLKRLHHKSHKVDFEPAVELADGMDEEQAFSKLAEIYRQMVAEVEVYENTLLGKIFNERTER